MSADLPPPPPVAPNVVLRDFAYMPLDVVRLRDSDFISAASGEGFRCAVLLWCVSWHQEPAGSLPNDEQFLASKAGYPRSPREWKKYRDDALHGWVLCSDGRLYHPVIAEKANAAWTARLRERWRTNCNAIKKAAQRHRETAVYPTFEQWREHFEATGSESWRPNAVPGDNPGGVTRDNGGDASGDNGKCPPTVPGDIDHKRSKGKGSDLSGTEGVTTPPPAAAGSGDDRPADHFGQFEGHANPQRPVLSPLPQCCIDLRRAGVEATSMDRNLVAFVEEGGTAAQVIEIASTPEFQGKKPTYITAAALRMLRDGQKQATGGTHANGNQRSGGRDSRGQSLADRSAAAHDGGLPAGRSEPAAGAGGEVLEGSAVRVG